MEKYQYKFDRETCMYKDICCSYATDECNSVCDRYIITNFLLFHSKLPPNHRNRKVLHDVPNDMKSIELLRGIRTNIKDFIKSGHNLYIYSDNRYNGKTSWAISLMQKYFDEIWQYNGFIPRGVFISVPMFLMRCKDAMSNPNPDFEQLKNLIRNVDVVIWDDIATCNLSNFEQGFIYAFIQERMLNGKSNIYTGTFNDKEMYNGLGANLAGCICSNLFTVRLRAGRWGDK